MPLWGNTDTNANRITNKFPQARIVREKKLACSINQAAGGTTINVDSNFTVVNATLTMIGCNVRGNNITSAQTVTAFSTNPVTGNTFITISNATTAAMKAGDVLTFGNNIIYHSNTYAATYNADTVLVTDTRRSNLYSNGVGANRTLIGGLAGAANANTQITPSTGWVHVQTGTGGRQGRVQIETLITLSNAQALNTLSGNTSNANVYYAGV